MTNKARDRVKADLKDDLHQENGGDIYNEGRNIEKVGVETRSSCELQAGRRPLHNLD